MKTQMQEPVGVPFLWALGLFCLGVDIISSPGVVPRQAFLDFLCWARPQFVLLRPLIPGTTWDYLHAACIAIPSNQSFWIMLWFTKLSAAIICGVFGFGAAMIDNNTYCRYLAAQERKFAETRSLKSNLFDVLRSIAIVLTLMLSGLYYTSSFSPPQLFDSGLLQRLITQNTIALGIMLIVTVSLLKMVSCTHALIRKYAANQRE